MYLWTQGVNMQPSLLRLVLVALEEKETITCPPIQVVQSYTLGSQLQRCSATCVDRSHIHHNTSVRRQESSSVKCQAASNREASCMVRQPAQPHLPPVSHCASGSAPVGNKFPRALNSRVCKFMLHTPLRKFLPSKTSH